MANHIDYFKDKAANWDEQPRRVELASAVAGAIVDGLPLNKDMRALDYGCGTGLVTLLVAEEVGSVLGVDISAEMLGQLDKKVAAGAATNVSTLCADILVDEEEIEGEFDLIFSAMALHHVNGVKRVLKVFHDKMKPGGMVALADLDLEDGSFHGGREGIAHAGFDRNEVVEMLEHSGFVQAEAATAHTISKPDSEGKMRDYTVFLIIAKKR